MTAPVPGTATASTQRVAYRGILWMIASVMLLNCVAAQSKWLSQTQPIEQVLWGRFFFNMVLLAVIFRAGGLRRLAHSRAPALQWSRSVLMLVLTLFLFISFHLLPLAQVMGILFLAPIAVTALAVPVLKEKVEGRMWFAVVGGFVGAMIIIRPSGDFLTLAVLAPLAAVACHATFQISTRYMAGRDDALTTTVYTPVAGTLYFTAVLPWHWAPLSPLQWLLMVGMGVFGTGAHFALVKAFEAAPASVVAPYYYVTIFGATLLGYVFFGDVPDALTFVGAAVIAACGLYIWHLENRRGRAAST